MTTIFFKDSFDSAHWLPYVPKDHKCHRMHGHTYRVEIQVTGEVDYVTGFVIDYAEVKRAWEPLKRFLDHRILNDVLGLGNPTCELMAKWIFDRLAPLPVSRVILYETEHCGVIYEGRHA